MVNHGPFSEASFFDINQNWVGRKFSSIENQRLDIQNQPMLAIYDASDLS